MVTHSGSSLGLGTQKKAAKSALTSLTSLNQTACTILAWKWRAIVKTYKRLKTLAGIESGRILNITKTTLKIKPLTLVLKSTRTRDTTRSLLLILFSQTMIKFISPTASRTLIQISAMILMWLKISQETKTFFTGHYWQEQSPEIVVSTSQSPTKKKHSLRKDPNRKKEFLYRQEYTQVRAIAPGWWRA